MHTSNLTYWLKYYTRSLSNHGKTFESSVVSIPIYLFLKKKKKHIWHYGVSSIDSAYHYYWVVIVLRCKQMKIKWKLFSVGSGHRPFNRSNEKGGRARLVNHSAAYNILVYTLYPLRIFISISYYYRICAMRQRVIPTRNANWHSSSRGNRTRDRLPLFKNAYYCVYIITPLFPVACNYTARRYSRTWVVQNV